MPIFEYQCTECNQAFEELVRSASAVVEIICPKCGSTQVKKMISTFASKAAGGSSATFSTASSSCGSGSV